MREVEKEYEEREGDKSTKWLKKCKDGMKRRKEGKGDK
jgi:hypothetical protein